MERKNNYGGHQGGKSYGGNPRNNGGNKSGGAYHQGGNGGYQQQYSEEGNFHRGGGGGQGNFQQGKKPYYNNASGPSTGYAQHYQRPQTAYPPTKQVGSGAQASYRDNPEQHRTVAQTTQFGKPKMSEGEEVKRAPLISTPSPKAQATFESRTPGAANKGAGTFATRP